MNKKIVAYDISCGDTMDELTEQVGVEIDAGLQPLGGVCLDGRQYCQVVVEYED